MAATAEASLLGTTTTTATRVGEAASVASRMARAYQRRVMLLHQHGGLPVGLAGSPRRHAGPPQWTCRPISTSWIPTGPGGRAA